MVTKRFSRRTFLRFAGLGAAALFVGRARVSPALEAAAASSRAPLAPARQPVIELPLKQAATDTLEVNMRAVPSEVSILPGARTRVWTYQASVVQGDPAMVAAVPESYLGPVIRVRKGQHLKINFTNDLPQETTVHAHGPCIPSSMGGHPHPSD